MKRKRPFKKVPTGLNPSPRGEGDLLNQVLQDIDGAPPEEILKRLPDASMARRLIETLPANESMIPLLLAVKERFRDKKVQKAVKRWAFKLKQKGIPVGALVGEEGPSVGILKPVQRESPRCYVGAVDGAGGRVIMLILHRGVQGFDIAIAVVSDKKGFEGFLWRTVSKKEAKDLREKFEADAGPFVETSLAHAATLLEEAYHIHRAEKSSLPPDYLEFRSLFVKETLLLDRAVVYDWVPEPLDAGSSLRLQDLQELFEHPVMRPFVMERETLKPFLQAILKVEESPIYLSEGQRAERVREIQEKCAAELFPSLERDRLKRRLEEMAYFLYKQGEEETARLAVAAASVAPQEHTTFRPNPVIQALVAHSLDWYLGAMEKLGREPSLGEEARSPIILP